MTANCNEFGIDDSPTSLQWENEYFVDQEVNTSNTCIHLALSDGMLMVPAAHTNTPRQIHLFTSGIRHPGSRISSLNLSHSKVARCRCHQVSFAPGQMGIAGLDGS